MILFNIFVLWERNTRIKRIIVIIASISYVVACAMLIKYLGPITGAYGVDDAVCILFSYKSIDATIFITVPSDETHILACADVFDPKLSLGLWVPAVDLSLRP